MKSWKYVLLNGAALAVFSLSSPVFAQSKRVMPEDHKAAKQDEAASPADQGAPANHAQIEEKIVPLAHPDAHNVAEGLEAATKADIEAAAPVAGAAPAAVPAAIGMVEEAPRSQMKMRIEPVSSGSNTGHDVSSAAQDLPVSAQAEAPRWGYAGDENPFAWAALDGQFKTCADGKAQSPVDIAQYMQEDLPKLKIAYAPMALQVVNSGRGIGVMYEPGSKFMSGETIYDLLHFSFHAPGEHYVNGAPYPLEMQLMHRAENGEMAALAVLFKLGAANPALQMILDNVPPAGQTSVRTDLTLDVTGLLPENVDYYAYTGSLTAPPCSEGVKWHVLKTPAELSLEQLHAFQKLYSANARPVQPLNGRIVKGN